LTKVSVYLDEELWTRFKQDVLRKHGTLRKLSEEVESLIRASVAEYDLRKAFENMNLKTTGRTSPQEIKKDRPRTRGPPSELLVRRMRRRRLAEAIR